MMTRNSIIDGSIAFNSSIELAARIAIILTGLSNRCFDLDELVFFDYVLLYSKEFGGPSDIHPPVPNHLAEIVHRRENFPEALRLLASRGLVVAKVTGSGLYYASTDRTAQFARALRSSYYTKMWSNLFWMEDNYRELSSRYTSFLKIHGDTHDNKED